MSKEYKVIPGFESYKISDTGAVRNVKNDSPVAITAGSSYLLDDKDGKRHRMKKDDLIEKAWGKKPEEKPVTKIMGGAEKFVEERAERGRKIRMPEHKPSAPKTEKRGDIKSPIPELPKAKKDYPQYVHDILKKDESKSEKIRQLHKRGFDVSEIAGLIGNGYGFVYNVINPPKKKGVLPAKPAKKKAKKSTRKSK